MLTKSKEQFDSGGIVYDYKILIHFDEKLNTIEDIEKFVSEYAIGLKFNLMCKLYPELSEEFIHRELINKELLWVTKQY